jgi:hypothetical protein
MNALLARLSVVVVALVLASTLQAQTLSFSDLTVFPRALIVNDSVMGGISNSQLLSEDDYNRFRGRVSLDNNGGFASVRFLISNPVSDSETVSLRVKGDGQLYQLRFRMAGNWQALAYSVKFQTIADTWQTFDFKVGDFLPVWRGRTVYNAPSLNLANAQQVSIFIADKQQGPFSILLDSLSFTGNK